MLSEECAAGMATSGGGSKEGVGEDNLRGRPRHRGSPAHVTSLQRQRQLQLIISCLFILSELTAEYVITNERQRKTEGFSIDWRN